jgi:hypothetical protein
VPRGNLLNAFATQKIMRTASLGLRKAPVESHIISATSTSTPIALYSALLYLQLLIPPTLWSTIKATAVQSHPFKHGPPKALTVQNAIGWGRMYSGQIFQDFQTVYNGAATTTTPILPASPTGPPSSSVDRPSGSHDHHANTVRLSNWASKLIC